MFIGEILLRANPIIFQLSISLLEAARQWYMANPKSSFWSSVLLPGKAGNRSKAFRMGPQAEASLPAATNDV